MLRFEPFSGSLDDWGNVLNTFPDREIFQTPAWLRFLAESQRADPVVAVLKDGADIAGYFAGLIVRKLGLRILGSPFIGWTTEHMGIRLREGVSRRDALQAMTAFAFSGLGCVQFEFCDPAFGPADVDGLGFQHSTCIGTVVDLAPDEDTIYSGFSSKSCRYSIRKAQKLGVVIEEACGEGFADDYYAQLRDVFAKQSLVPTYGKKRVELLIKHLMPTGDLLLLRARDPAGRCIATGIFLGTNQTAYFWGNASWRQDQQFCPNEAIHWHAMRYWKRRGIRKYDLCGGGDYKRKYGGAVSTAHQFRKSKYFWVAAARNVAYRCFRIRQNLLGRNAHRQTG
jgi:hypothetical protein